MPEPRDLPALREAIEAIDRELLSQLRRRMDLAEEVAAAKLRTAYPFRDEPREDQIIQRVRHAAVERGLDAHEIERLYRVILDMSVAHQKAHVRALAAAPLRVAYQGVEGSYSHLTAQRRYAGLPEGVLLEGFETFRGAVEAVRGGTADRALLPIENSVSVTLDLLAGGGSELEIVAEALLLVRHSLIAAEVVELREIDTVLSHPQGLLQCEDFLRSATCMKPQVEFDTAGSARKVRERNDPTVAAIAGEHAAKVFGLEVLRRGIQSQEGNYTRFVELAHDPIRFPPETPAKTSLLLALPHTPGALAEVLGVLSRRGVNLAKLESRPIPESPFKYRFYLDIDGNAGRDPVRGALAEVAPLTTEMRVLGSYPAAEKE